MMIDDGDDGVEEDNARLSFVRWSPAVRVLSLSLIVTISVAASPSLSLFICSLSRPSLHQLSSQNADPVIEHASTSIQCAQHNAYSTGNLW